MSRSASKLSDHSNAAATNGCVAALTARRQTTSDYKKPRVLTMEDKPLIVRKYGLVAANGLAAEETVEFI